MLPSSSVRWLPDAGRGLPVSDTKMNQDEPLAIGQHDAARLAGVSAKTLERLAAAGEQVGRIKVGGRVLYHRPTLARWLEQQAVRQMGGAT